MNPSEKRNSMTNDGQKQEATDAAARDSRPRVPIATMTGNQDYGTMSQSSVSIWALVVVASFERCKLAPGFLFHLERFK